MHTHHGRSSHLLRVEAFTVFLRARSCGAALSELSLLSDSESAEKELPSLAAIVRAGEGGSHDSNSFASRIQSHPYCVLEINCVGVSV